MTLTHSERGRISGYPNDDSSRGGVYPYNYSWNPVHMQVMTGQTCLLSLDVHSHRTVTEQLPISKFGNLFQRHRPNKPQQQPEAGIELWPVSQPRVPCGLTPANNPDDPTISSLIHSAFSSERDAHRYAK